MTLIVLFLIYFGLEALFYFFGPGHNVKYLVDNYDIKESFTNNQKDELSNYYFEISKDDFRIDLQIFDNLLPSLFFICICQIFLIYCKIKTTQKAL